MTLATRRQYVLVNPVSRPQSTTFQGAPRLRELGHKRLGIIDDSKENAQELLEELTDLLRQRFGLAQVVYHRKPSASKPAAMEVIEELAQTCDYVLVAIGS